MSCIGLRLIKFIVLVLVLVISTEVMIFHITARNTLPTTESEHLLRSYTFPNIICVCERERERERIGERIGERLREEGWRSRSISAKEKRKQ